MTVVFVCTTDRKIQMLEASAAVAVEPSYNDIDDRIGNKQYFFMNKIQM